MTPKRTYQYYFRSLIIRRTFIALLLLAQLALVLLSILHYSHMRRVGIFLNVLAILTSFHLLTHPIPASMKISMVFLILLFPLPGGAFYWFFHFQTTTVGYRKALRRISASTASAFRVMEDAAPATQEAAPEAQKLIRYLDAVPNYPVYGNTETEYYSDGADFRDALLSAIRGAQRYVFLEYFIISEGSFWDSVLDVLTERAANGVDVRVIYDDLGSYVTLPPKFADRLHSLGIACRAFNPFVPFLTAVQNNRDHRKIAVIDGHIAFTGGINLADEYINLRMRFGHWKDAVLRLSGDGAWSLTVMFLQMWSFLTNRREEWERYLPFSPQQLSSGSMGWVQPYTDSPIDGEQVSEQVYLQLIHGAREQLWITTPYLAPDACILSALKSAAKCGVDVRLILPGIPDKRTVHFTGRSYYRELLDAGVRIFEYDGFIHSKNMIVDGQMACIGTVNMDFRSLYLHFECGVCLYRTPSIRAMRSDFLDTLTRSVEITQQACRCGPFKKLLQDICRLFAPLM